MSQFVNETSFSLLILALWRINKLAYFFVGSEGFEPPKSKDS